MEETRGLGPDSLVETRGGGRFRAELRRAWNLFGPNGGYLTTIAARAAAVDCAFPVLVTSHVNFLSAGRFEPVDLAVEVLRSGRTAELRRVVMSQGERRLLEATLWFASPGDGLEHDGIPMPDVPPSHGVDPIEKVFPPDRIHPFWRNVERRTIDPMVDAVEVEREPVSRGWFRFRPEASFADPVLDAGRALVLLDTLSYPAARMRHPRDERFIAVSLDFHAALHRPLASEWLLVECRAPLAASGRLAFASRIWSEDGTLAGSGTGTLLFRPMPRSA